MISRREFLKTASCVGAALSPFNRFLNKVVKNPDSGWAPHIITENEIHHMFYTEVIISWGKNSNILFTQSILHATSNDPSNPSSWEVDGDFVFQPNHEMPVKSRTRARVVKHPKAIFIFNNAPLFNLLIDHGLVWRVHDDLEQ